jgi:hypothetical protein
MRKIWIAFLMLAERGNQPGVSGIGGDNWNVNRVFLQATI